MGSGKKVTVGYHYYLGLHFGICHGPADAMQKIVIGERDAWSGLQDSSGSIYINKPDLFGGKKREGGVVGTLDVLMGESSQGVNSYLSQKINGTIPAFRGILSAVWTGGKVTANNPYLKPWAFKVRRILQGWSGGSAWYPETAQILSEACGGVTYDSLVSVGSTWDYRTVPYTDTASYIGNMTSSGSAPFSNALPHPYDDPPFLQTGGTTVGLTNTLWMEKTVSCALGKPIELFIKSDNLHWLYIDGVLKNTTAVSGSLWVGWAAFMPSSTSFTVTIKVTEGQISDPFPGNYKYADCYIRQMSADVIDMNPAHIIYQCLTDTAWGMGYPTSSIDTTTFTAVANTLYAEGFGLSLLWNQQETIDNFIAIILDHIGGILYVEPSTGKFALKLIRADYDRSALTQYGPSTLISAEDYQRQAWGETVNEITVVYINACTEKEESITVQDIANISVQGGVVAQTRNYHGIRKASLAQRVAMRDLQAAATPLAKIKLTATRSAWQVFPGDVFRLTWPEYDIDDVVFRALTINRGTLTDGQIIIDAVEDIFGLPSNTYLTEQPGGWEDPSQLPSAAAYRKLLEAPYWDLARNLSAADLDYTDPLAGYVETLAVRPSSDSINYDIQAKVGAASYESIGSGDFCPSATVLGALTKTTTSITMSGGVDLDIVESGGYAVIDNEYVLVTDIDDVSGTAIISRGVLDTVPVEHISSSRIWFADGFQGFSTTEYVDSEVVDVKMLPATGKGTLDISLATADSLTMDQRQYRPYPPGKLLVNTSQYPEWIDGQSELSLSWAHRDRLAQTAYIVEQSAGNIGPEANTTYTLRIYSESDTLLRTESAISSTTYSYASSNEIYDGGGGEDSQWSNVTLLLNCNGVDGSTTITDASSSPWTYTVYGNARISTTQSKYGGASLYFDGTGDYVESAVTSDYLLGSADFTLEAWVYRTAANDSKLFGIWSDTSGTGFSWKVSIVNGGIHFMYSTTGANYFVFGPSSAGGVPLYVWTHMAFCRNGSTLRGFVNGTQVLINSSFSATFYAAAGTKKFELGRDGAGNASYFTGYLDDIRITKYARYVANFTPSTTQLGQYTDGRLNGRLRFELESVRGGLVSYQKHNHTVLREGYGFNYGYYYGGQ